MTVLGRTLRSRPVFLQPAFGDAVDRRHLRAGVGGRNSKDGQRRFQGDRLAETRRRAAADRHRAIRAQALCFGARRTRGFNRHMHGGARKNTGAALAQPRGDLLRLCLLLRGREHERALRAKEVYLARQLINRARPEHDASRKLVIRK